MFHPQSQLEPARLNQAGQYVIDCDPDIFSVLLNWLRYNKVLLPTNMSADSVAVVAEYFGLTSLVKALSPPEPQHRPAFPDIVPLDVRGRKMNINRSFLTRYPNSYLAEMFSVNSRYTPTKLSSDDSFSIDADPECFSVIINFLQYDRVILPHIGGPTIHDVRFVANQFGLGNEISLALEKVEDRLSDCRVRMVPHMTEKSQQD